MTQLADSTIAMGAYNLLAHAPIGLSVADLSRRLSVWGFPTSKRTLERIVAKLHARGYVLSGKKLRVVDPKRRLCTIRDRRDTEGTDPGWRGWAVRDPQGYYYPLDEIVAEVRAGARA